MDIATKLDKQINEYLLQLNEQQKKAVLMLVKAFAEDQVHDVWQDEGFIAELDRRTAEFESGKAKMHTRDDLESKVREAYQSKAPRR